MALLAKISKWAGMGEDGLFWVEGMSAKKINNYSVLSPTWQAVFKLSEDTSGFANIGTTTAMAALNHTSDDNIITLSRTGYIHSFAITGGYTIGEIHHIPTISNPIVNSPADYADLLATQEGNLIYSCDDCLGIGYRGQCASGSGTEKIIDADGRNFDTLGIRVGDKVFNFDNEEEYTITSISTTTETNDTLNFSAGTANAEDDWFMVFSDIGANNSGNYWQFFDTTAYPHFKDQEDKGHFKRQVLLYDTDYLIGNGNWIAALNVDETTWNDNFKQLPEETQFLCMDINQSRLLVGGKYQGKGRLMLWDGYSAGWLSIVDLEQKPTCIRRYKNGWLVTLDNTIFFTDGYDLQAITQFPDMDGWNLLLSIPFNGLKVVNEKIICSIDPDRYTRAKSGIGVYDFKTGWTFVPFNQDGSYPLKGLDTVGPIFTISDTIYTSFSVSSGSTHLNVINSIAQTGGRKPSFITFLKFPKKVTASLIKLTLSPKFDENNELVGSSDVVMSVAIGDGKRPFWNRNTCGAGCTTTSIVNPYGNYAYREGRVGQQIRILDGKLAGERSYITAIADPGTVNEVWTISPALSEAPAEFIELNRLNLKKCDIITIDGDQLPEEISFNVDGHFSDMLYIEVFTSIAVDSLNLDIHSLEVYGN